MRKILLVLGDLESDLASGIQVAESLGDWDAVCVWVKAASIETASLGVADTLKIGVGGTSRETTGWYASPLQALELIKRVKPDALLCDLGWSLGASVAGTEEIIKFVAASGNTELISAFTELEKAEDAHRIIVAAYGVLSFLKNNTTGFAALYSEAYAPKVYQFLLAAGCNEEQIHDFQRGGSIQPDDIADKIQRWFWKVDHAITVESLYRSLEGLHARSGKSQKFGGWIHDVINDIGNGTDQSRQCCDLFAHFVGMSADDFRKTFVAPEGRLPSNVRLGFKSLLGVEDALNPPAAWLVALSVFRRCCPDADWRRVFEVSLLNGSLAAQCQQWPNITGRRSTMEERKASAKLLEQMWQKLFPWVVKDGQTGEHQHADGKHAPNLTEVKFQASSSKCVDCASSEPGRLPMERPTCELRFRFRMSPLAFAESLMRSRPQGDEDDHEGRTAGRALFAWLSCSLISNSLSDRQTFILGSRSRRELSPLTIQSDPGGTLFSWSW